MDKQLPWHEPLWQQFRAQVSHDRLPHALLLSGIAGLGKGVFARRMAQALLCETPTASGDGCDGCRFCHLFYAGSHPDYRVLMPEEKSGVIKVDAVRELCAFLDYTAQYGGHKIALLESADCLNGYAANSLLKTLEEPSAGSVLLLITTQPVRLPATVRSRCQRINFVPPSSQMALSWLAQQVRADIDPELVLEVSGGAPLTALSNVQSEYWHRRQELFTGYQQLQSGRGDPLQVAEAWAIGNVVENLRWLIGWHTDLIRLKMDCHAPCLSHPDLYLLLQAGIQQQSLPRLFERLDAAIHLHHLCTTTQVNTHMQLEAFFSGSALNHSDTF
ncbi:MAG: DNA polymerase III subunit delta' [Candidatus Contendobacter odensis]|uniref:DNA polymerase III subunit delta' n=1 Tax=Candidatus Contendibacter odensensis TaxID=1400860 RepID=A0A2G6PFR1_9GAMM|nr:MAG: DNA polymerase III subunit delta' [Candidatus Contendobacter odensis]